MRDKGLYLQLISIHGLVRGSNLEMGRNADTGGQITYVLELAKALGQEPEVEQVDVVTRWLDDKTLSPDYSRPIEQVADKVRIVRIQCGGGKYLRKELLWPHLDEFVDKLIKFIKKEDRIPDLVHGHYADAGYVARELGNFFGMPFIFTGHSLGRNKKLRLQENGMDAEEMQRKFQIDQRIQVEEKIINDADLIITSTRQEIEKQYGLYDAFKTGHFTVIPPGVDTSRFYPFYDARAEGGQDNELIKQAQFFMHKELKRFLSNPGKPLILALSRPARRKNIAGLVTAYGTDKELQAIANLAVFAGIRKDISAMDENEREVLTELLLLMDKFDLYGKLAIPKRHDFEYEVPELYRIAARNQGVFVNPAFIEPFGLTLIEAAATGLPIVATNDGGPRDIVDNCENGILVEVNNHEEIAAALRKILVDPELWKQYSYNGIQGVRNHYSWRAHCTTYLAKCAKLPTKAQAFPGIKLNTGEIGRRMAKLKKLIITDIDDTLLGDVEALQQLFAQLGEHRTTVGFGVATGRTVTSAVEILQEHGAPIPDVIIASVGSEIYYGERLLPDKGWQTHIAFQWQREKITRALASLDFLTLQEPETQRNFKISYYMADAENQLVTIHRVLTENRLRYTLIYSNGQFLDILPYRASKGKAVRYLCYKWNIAAENVLVAGDSGNDEEMLRGQMLGVVVGNHTSEIEKLRGLKRIYFSPANHAAGILDGLQYYRFLDGD